MAKGIGLQPASLRRAEGGTLNCIAKKNEKNHSAKKYTPIKKRHTAYTYIQLIPRWWPGTPWPFRFAPICEETC